MSSLEDIGCFAIDGGGTRCRFAFERGAERCDLELGPANVFTDFDGSVARILSGLQALSDRVGLEPEQLRHIPGFVGLAGVMDKRISRCLAAVLNLDAAQISDDRPAAVRGALGRGDGMVAHCGTGSFFAAQRDRHIRLVGGWGAALGDEASAQWVGRKALNSTLRHVDGLSVETGLHQRILEKFGGASGILKFSITATPMEYGAIAPLVTEEARRGDIAAEAILREGAAFLSGMFDELGWQNGQTLCLTGGIAPHYQPYLPAEKKSVVAPALGSPLDGALDLARSHAGGR